MPSRPLLLALGALATGLIDALSETIWGIPDFTRIHGLSSLVRNNVLYLDGGELFNGTKSDNISDWTMASTVMISLDVPWSAANVMATAIDKPRSFTYAQQPYIWYNPVEDKIQYIGGLVYFYGDQLWRVSRQKVVNAEPYIPGQALWELRSGSQEWVQSEFQPPSYIGIFQFGAGIATYAALYALGSSIYTSPDYTIFARSGLVEFDFRDRHWYNRSTQGYGPKGSGIYAQAVYTSLFGTDGVIFYIGGYTVQHTRKLHQGSPQYLQDMSEIMMWDIGRKRVISQRTTGSKPPSRWECMTVGVSEPGSGTFDMIHGGFTAEGVNEVFQPDIANVYVLSIPSFVWTKIPGSTAIMRGFGTAQVIGQSQMVIVGGTDATSPSTRYPADTWDNAIGLFDLNSWRWTTQYRPDAGPYKRASTLVEVSQKTPYANFDSPEVAAVFNPQGRKATPGTSSMTGGSSDNSINTGAIAGGVVGGVIAVGVIAALAWFFMARRKRKSNAKAAEPPSDQRWNQDVKTVNQDVKTANQEIDGSGRKHELQTGQGEQWEIGSSAVVERHELEGPARPAIQTFGDSRDSDTLVGFRG